MARVAAETATRMGRHRLLWRGRYRQVPDLQSRAPPWGIESLFHAVWGEV